MDLQKIETAIRQRMSQKGVHETMIHEYLRRVRLVCEGDTGRIPWSEIADLHASDTVAREDLPEDAADLSKLAAIKLNGGLGTSMGLAGPKTLLPVRDGKNFLQIILEQVRKQRQRGIELPMFFMNSFSTRAATLRENGVAELNAASKLPVDFLQNMVPRIRADDLLPIGDGSADADWCPPGHGDIYLSLQITGILDQLLDRGYRAAFISNGDNLGATVDESIYAYFMKERLDFAMELTPKTRADLKGGVLYRRLGKSVGLLETAQVEEQHLPDFQDTQRFAHFSTNNLWVNLEALRDKLRADTLWLSLIVNPKEVCGVNILQLETAMGAAIGLFERTRGIIVPRQRFSPVKNCSDLLVRRSDTCILRETDAALISNPKRTLSEPIVKLDDSYKKLADFEGLFQVLPSLLQAESFEVQGKILFDKKVTIKGKVRLSYAGAEPYPISRAGQEVFQDTNSQL